MGYDARFQVWRGDSTDGGLEDFTVEVNEGEVVLDVIHRLQATQTPDLAVRWNCTVSYTHLTLPTNREV